MTDEEARAELAAAGELGQEMVEAFAEEDRAPLTNLMAFTYAAELAKSLMLNSKYISASDRVIITMMVSAAADLAHTRARAYLEQVDSLPKERD